MLHFTPLCSLSLLHTLLKAKCMCLQDECNCKSLVLQDKSNIEIFLSPEDCDDFLICETYYVLAA